MISEKESGFSCRAEAALIKQAQAGNQESLNLLLLRHERLVHWVVRRQWLYTLPYEAAIQEGRRGLRHAILGFDPERGNRFSTYAYPAIMKYVWAGVKAEVHRSEREIPTEVLGLYFYENSPDPARLREWEDVRQSLLALVKRLPETQAQVIQMHYGLDGYVPHSQPEIAKRLGVSKQWISQLEIAALVWLRQPAHSQELRSLLVRHDLAQYELADRLAQVWLRRRGGRNGHH
jgi:RNA polymerase sporulation-specific sigma factor